jgi:hypothetical protein
MSGSKMAADNRRTMEEVFRAWLYREPLTAEERYRLMHCARDIERDAATSWPHHALIYNTNN